MRPILAALVAVIAASAAFSLRAQQITFSSRVEAVRVDVLVTDRGRPVRGLGPSDFDLTDNGVPQRVDLVSFEQLPLNVVLALDMSDSVIGERLAHLRAAGRSLLAGLEAGDQAALVTFSEAVALRAAPTVDLGRVRAALEAAEPSGATSVIDASFAALTVGESGVGRGLVMLFSDGLDTGSWLQADQVIDIARRCDAVLYAVSAGGIKQKFLEKLTDETGGRQVRVESTKDVGAAFVDILNEFRQRYVVSYTPTGVAKDGWHELRVRVKHRSVSIKARPGYLAQF